MEVMIVESISSNKVLGFKNPSVSLQTESDRDKHQTVVEECPNDLGIPAAVSSEVSVPSKVSEKPYSFTINKTKVIINGGTKELMRRGLELFNKFNLAEIGGVWSSDYQMDETTLVFAEEYLWTILAKNDVSAAESEALIAADEFLKANENELSKLIHYHTDNVMELGMTGAILKTQQECPFGFNETRCTNAFTGNWNWDKLFSVASVGAVRSISESFIPQSPSLRPSGQQIKFAKVFLAHALKGAMEGQTMIVESNKIKAEDLLRSHYSENVFQPKPGKALGRCCINLSKGKDGNFLNTPESKIGADERYGIVTNPSIVSIANMIVEFAKDLGIPISKLVAFKDDINMAHNQQKYSVDDVFRTCSEIAGFGLTIVNTRCQFGDNLASGVFDIIARGADEEIISLCSESLVKSINIRYVDDTNSFSPETDAPRAQGIVQEVWEKILGEDIAINMKKRELPTKIVVNIGFKINLLNGSIRPDDKGLEKLFIVFFCVFKLFDPMSLVERQVVAGTAQAYVKCMKGMAEFVDPLHKFCVGSEWEVRSANASQRQCAQFWQAALMGTFRDYSKWEIPLEIVGRTHKDSKVKPHYKFISDSSELASAIFIYSNKTNELLAWSRVFFTDWKKDCIKGGSAQNMREFMSVIFMMIMLSQSDIPSNNAIVEIWGDNTAALAWADGDHRCKSGERYSQLAFIGLSLCVQSTGIFTHHTTQIKSEEMGYVDKVSRTSSDEEFGFLSQDIKVDCNSIPCIAELLVLCNPDNKENNLNHHDAHIIMARIMQTVKNNIPKNKLSCSFEGL